MGQSSLLITSNVKAVNSITIAFYVSKKNNLFHTFLSISPLTQMFGAKYFPYGRSNGVWIVS